MSIEQVLIGVLGLSCGVLGWFARELYTVVKQLQVDMRTLEVNLNREYVRYDRLQDALKPILEGVQEIRKALEKKADREDHYQR